MRLTYQAPGTKRAVEAARPVRTGLFRSHAAPARESCSCGGTCSKCSQAWENPPDVEDFDDEGLAPHEADPVEADLLPHDDSATIVCDGAGGYGVSLGWAATAECGIGDCVRGHEESHARDWAGRWPDGCKNADGTPKPAGSDIPLGGPGYDTFLKESECRSYTGEIPCGEKLLASASEDCKPKIEKQLKVWRQRKDSYCKGGC